MEKRTQLLKQYFGHSAFRPGQERVVDAILDGRDAVCVMPTGAGKSVCYQIPALMLDGITLVISPLISLMKDQVNALTQNGIPAAYLNSSLTSLQYVRVIENIRRGAYKLIYVAPERLVLPEFINVCREVKVSLIAVDEAHCISQWGQDFRPSYQRIANFVSSLCYRPIIAAFTATATAAVKEDIERSLRLYEPFRITTGFDRPNLRFEVMRPKEKYDALTEILKRHGEDAGIIYCSTRKTVEEVGQRLRASGYPATIYHAGLDDDVRKQNQEDFVYDRKRIMVATNAFGMGIDKSDVSYVVHYNMPKDVESYYQEAGRAGRDGSAAECILLYSPADVHLNQFLIESSEPDPELTQNEQEQLKARDYERLKQMTFYSTTNNCLRRFILEYFGERAQSYCGNCSSCLTQFVEVDVTVEAQKILSCIKRTGERFGKKMICDVLRGSKGEKLLRLGLDSQTTYGLMKDLKESEVRDIIDYLEYEGYIEVRGTEYPVLAVAEMARDVLFGNEHVTMKQAKPKKPAERKTGTGGAHDVDKELLAALKALRQELAKKKRVPAYMVFSDATLIDMCKRLPQDAEGLLEVSGVGEVKLRQYGDRFLNVLKLHASKNK